MCLRNSCPCSCPTGESSRPDKFVPLEEEPAASEVVRTDTKVDVGSTSGEKHVEEVVVESDNVEEEVEASDIHPTVREAVNEIF